MRERERPGPTAAIAALGFAVLALTPAAPHPLAHPEVPFLHLFALVHRVRAALGRSLEEPARDALTERVRSSLDRWDAWLRTGTPSDEGVVARIVEVDESRRRLLVDAGEGVSLHEGDWVAAAGRVVGVLERVDGPFGVVKTPWSPDARFYAACTDASGRAVRLILVGLERRGWCAAVRHPERLAPIAEGAATLVPPVDDLLPASVPRLPEGLLYGTVRRDETLGRRGIEGWIVEPAVDPRALDAVVVRGRASGPRMPPFQEEETRSAFPLAASAARDQWAVFAAPCPIGSALVGGGRFLGTIRASWAGAAKVRGVFDPGPPVLLLACGPETARPLLARPVAALLGGGAFEAAEGFEAPARSDVVATAGRGLHVARGLPIGAVVRVEGRRFWVWRGRLSEGGPFLVRTRRRPPDRERLEWPP